MTEPGGTELPPPDVVPRTGLTPDVLRLMDASEGQLTITFPGEVIEDIDGVPNGVGPSTTVTAASTVRISRAELESTGLPEKEIKNVRITD